MAVDKQAVRELVVTSENDGRLFTQSEEPIQKNLLRKASKGQYDHELAQKIWFRHAGRAFEKYEKEFGTGSLGTRPTREFLEEVASEFADNFANENNLPKTTNPSVVRFGKQQQSTFVASSVVETGFKAGSTERKILNVLNRKRSGVTAGELRNQLNVNAGGPTANSVIDAVRVLQNTGFIEKGGVTAGGVLLKSAPKSRRMERFKNATTLIPIKVGTQDVGNIVGRKKERVAGTEKVVVRQPKATDKAWTVTVSGVGQTGDLGRKENVTLREAKSFARSAITGKGKGKIRREF